VSNFVTVLQYCTVVRGVAQVLIASRVILYLIYSYNDGITDHQRLSDLHLVCTLYLSHLLFDEDELPVLKF
jgi:hypothetical protein